MKSECTSFEIPNELHFSPVSVSLRNISNGSVDTVDGEGTRHALRINVLVHILLNLGAKSFSHSFAAIAKFHATFKALADQEDGEKTERARLLLDYVRSTLIIHLSYNM